MLSVTASAHHAAAAMLRGIPLADQPLAEALAEPVRDLNRFLSLDQVDYDVFFDHLIPLSAAAPQRRELALTVHSRCLGRGRAETQADVLTRHLRQVEQACLQTLPGLVDQLELRSGPICEQWEARGPGLLFGIARTTDAGLLVENARVVLVHPALGGAGAAHVAHNAVTLEAVLANPVDRLPEVVRLGWLLSQLNLDLPQYSETIHASRRGRVIALSMVLPTLVAAAQVELVGDPVSLLDLALTTWRLQSKPASELVPTLLDWWQTYQNVHPAWHVALAALDKMLTFDVPA